MIGVLHASEGLLERNRRSALEDDSARRRHPHEPRLADPQRPGARGQGIPAKDAAVTAEAAPVLRRQALRAGAQLQPRRAPQVTVRLAQLDHALKGGSRLAADLELERALIEITQRRDEPDRGCVELLRGGETSRAACDFLRAPVFRCSAPRATAVSIHLTRLRCSVSAAAASPSSTIVARRFVSVLIVER